MGGGAARRANTIERMPERHRAVRVGDWKLVAAKGDPWELYDLRTDRAESHDLAAEHPEKARELQRAWEAQTAAMTKLASKTVKPPRRPKKKRP